MKSAEAYLQISKSTDVQPVVRVPLLVSKGIAVGMWVFILGIIIHSHRMIPKKMVAS
jgi:hypothetical protein